MQLSSNETKAVSARPENLGERLYQQIKDEIFEFRLLPGDRFSEGEVAARMAVSRTPVRQALYRLEREGYLEVHFRSGWQVVPFDFERFEELYDLRIVLELAAVRRLCEMASEPAHVLADLTAIWLVDESQWQQDGQLVSQWDEAFHCQLVEATGNREMTRVHREVTEKIRIIRRLDFTQRPRVAATYAEHGAILTAILHRRSESACQLLRAHIEVSKAEVRKITLHMLHSARQRWPSRSKPAPTG
ncbi:MAG: GntR family transcriptional regulator [Pseudomonas sp.]